MTLYLLYHRHWIDEEYYDTKLIGIYSSKSIALCTTEKFSNLPGFCDFKTGFHIETVNLKAKKLKKGTLYLLTVTKVLDDDEITVSYRACSNVIFARLLCIVQSIILYVKRQKIYIDKYNIDEDNWTEGFVVMETP